MNLVRTLGYLLALTLVCLNLTLIRWSLRPTCNEPGADKPPANIPPPVLLSASEPEQSGSQQFLDKKGFELGDNHGSPRECNELLFQFFRGTYAKGSGPLKILDVGGGQ